MDVRYLLRTKSPILTISVKDASVPSESGVPAVIIRFRSANAAVPAHGPSGGGYGGKSNSYFGDNRGREAGSNAFSGVGSGSGSGADVSGGAGPSGGGAGGHDDSTHDGFDARSRIAEAMQRIKPDLTMQDRLTNGLQIDRSEFRVQEELDASHFAASEANPVK